MEKINVMAIVRDYVEENRFSKASLARALGITGGALNHRINKDYMECDFLMKLCKALNHDFFADISELMGMPKKDEKVQELEKEIQMLQREKELLKEILYSRIGNR